MSRFQAILSLLAVVACVRAPPVVSARESVAMLGVSGGAGFDPRVVGTVEELLLAALDHTGRFAVIGQSDIARLVGFEKQKQMAGCTDTGCLAEIAGVLGVRYLASADLGRVGDAGVLSLKLMDVRTGTVIGRATRRVVRDSAILAAVDEVAREIAARLPEPVAPAPTPRPAAAGMPSPQPADSGERTGSSPPAAAPVPTAPRQARPGVPPGSKGSAARARDSRAEARPATLKVSAEDAQGAPVSARVRVDGTDLGSTPGEFRVPASARKVEVTSDGGSWSAPLALTEGKAESVRAKFPRKPKEAPAAPASAAGPAMPATVPPAPPTRRSFAVRAGVGGQTGVLGLGVEWRPSWFGLAVGTGTHRVSGGVTLGGADNRGGWYVDLHVADVSAGAVSGIPSKIHGIGAGATFGWDFRPAAWLSVKAGAGPGWNSERSGFLTWDLNMGPVF